ncbi:MAG: ABC transporter substrate-binding protein, partial [Chloroflexi bacterium]|nr:ABC transporter substrate-binding protein [Chloroflexota bacterium]
MKSVGLMQHLPLGNWGSMIRWLALALVLGLALVATACTSSTRNGTEPAPTATPTEEPGTTPTQRASTPTGEAQPSGETVEGGVLRRLFSDPATLDPHLTTDATSATIIVEVFGGLVTISPDLKVVPDIAESWSVSDDGRVYTFFLREDAVFHNGKPITANDFKWSLERAADAVTESLVVDQYLGDIVGVKEKLRGAAREIEGVRVIDDHTLEITIDQPKSYFLSKLTYPTAFVLDRENVESGRRWTRTPNGSGPFKLGEYVPGERLVLERNPNYHLGPPHLDKVELILGGGTAMLMYENDEIDITGVGLADLDRLLDPNNSLNAEL